MNIVSEAKLKKMRRNYRICLLAIPPVLVGLFLALTAAEASVENLSNAASGLITAGRMITGFGVPISLMGGWGLRGDYKTLREYKMEHDKAMGQCVARIK